METTRLSTKGQLILPKTLRDSRAWLPGTEFRVEETPEGVLLRPVSRFPQTRLEDVVGCLEWTGKPKTMIFFSGTPDAANAHVRKLIEFFKSTQRGVVRPEPLAGGEALW